MKLSPPLEAEEDSATRVVDYRCEQPPQHQKKRPAVTATVLLGEEEYNTLATALGNNAPGGSPLDEGEMDVEITDDEDEGKVGDDGDSAVGGIGIKRKRTVRVVIRSRAFI
jgi:hypothetical protein